MKGDEPSSHVAEVRRYYDKLTPSFLRFGQGRGFLHRAVWGPGVGTRRAAFHFVEDQIVKLARGLGSPSPLRVADLGCGVGASLCYIASRMPISGTGVTLSPLQARAARKRIEEAGLSGRVECIESDFRSVPLPAGAVDVAFAVESFAHAPEPERFFEEGARIVRDGGLLVVCDDVLREPAVLDGKSVVDRFVRGWQIASLLRREQIVALAREAGFELVSSRDLTPFLEIGRLRDWALWVFVTLVDWLGADPRRWGHLRGGVALQQCLARGWVGYELVVFRRNVATTGR